MPDQPVLTLGLTHPDASAATGPDGVWFATDLPEVELEKLAAAPSSIATVDELVHRYRDATVVFVGLHDGRPHSVTAWKGLLSGHAFHYVRREDGGWYLTDHFHNAVAVIPHERRGIADDALLNHYLSSTVTGRTTYTKGVDRLIQGDRVQIDLPSGSATVDVFSRHQRTATDEPLELHLDRLDGALEEVMAPLRAAGDVGVGFSGGVDSTLILSYLGNAGTPLTVLPGSPEFDRETDYAREAAGFLEREITEIRLDENDYLRRLEDHVALMASPPYSYVTSVLGALYEYPLPEFVLGEGADGVFGSGRGIRRVASTLSGPAGRGLLQALGKAPGPLGSRARQVDGYAALFAEPPDSPAGYAGRTLEYHGDMSHANAIFGEEAVADAYRRGLDLVRERVDLETSESDGFFRHIELAQWRLIFIDLERVGNHNAQALGKRQAQPFTKWRVVSEQLKVPAKQRYYRGMAGKWMLKNLLARRVPQYKVNQRKLATALPFGRYVSSGPLADFWDRYEIPDIVPPQLHETVRTTAKPLTWMAITHAIWNERVAGNPALEPHPAALEMSWPLAGAS